MRNLSGLTVFSIATSKYLDYWVDLIDSYFSTQANSPVVKWILLTDRPKAIPSRITNALGENLTIREIKHSEWPFPTLMRYQHILESIDSIKTPNFVYLDADMLIVSKDFTSTIMKLVNEFPLILVRHPGFYRETGFQRFIFYLLNPKFALRDTVIALKQGSIGTWEKTPTSKAFVPRNKRQKYVCGGIWFGNTAAIIEMCRQLSVSINEDLGKGFIAKFHDESHLNHFNAYNRVKLFPPTLCFDPSYPQLRNLSPIVIAVDKKVNNDA